MTKEIIIKEFITFLKENNVYQRYKMNISCSLFGGYNIMGYIFGFKSKVLGVYKRQPHNPYNPFAVENYINNAFTWNETKEGHKFWSNLDQKWRKVVVNKKLYIQE